MTPRRSFATLLLLPAVVALVAAGCTGGGDEATGTPSASASASASASSTVEDGPASPAPDAGDAGGTEDGEDSGSEGTDGASGGDGGGDGPDGSADATAAPFAADTSPDLASPSGSDTLLSVTAVRTGVHPGFDRVVFDLDGTGTGTPGWDVRYVPEALDDGSGAPVDVAGDVVLAVRISGTAMPTDSGVTEAGRTPIRPAGAQAVREVRYRSWFEGYSTAFVGIDGAERPFRVFLLTDPVRVVLDVRH